MHPEDLIAAWRAWDERPGNDRLTNALVDAQVAYAGRRHIDLCRHVTTQRRAGLSLSAAVYTWTQE